MFLYWEDGILMSEDKRSLRSKSFVITKLLKECAIRDIGSYALLSLSCMMVFFEQIWSFVSLFFRGG